MTFTNDSKKLTLLICPWESYKSDFHTTEDTSIEFEMRTSDGVTLNVLLTPARKTFIVILRSLEDSAAASLAFEARRDIRIAQFQEKAERAIKDAQGDSSVDVIRLRFEFGSDSWHHRLLLRDEKEFELVRELDDEDGFVVFWGTTRWIRVMPQIQPERHKRRT